MKRLVILYLLSIGLNCFSQDSLKLENDILKPSRFKKGIYNDFKHFRSNTPNSIKEFSFNKRSSSKIWAWGGTELEIVFVDNNIKKKYINDSIWGVCNGDSIFINNKLVSINKGFDKLEKLDYPLSYFVSYLIIRDEDNERAAMLSMFGAIGGAADGAPYKRVVIIDMRTGEFIRMNEYGFQKLLKDDNDLMAKYKKIYKNENNEKEIFRILEEYNLKNK